MSLHAERALVAALLLDPAQALTVDLAPADFQSQELPQVFSTIREMVAAGEPVDLTIVGGRLGMLAELCRLVKDTPAVTAHVPHYAATIRAHSWRRRMVATLRTKADELEGAADPQAVVSAAVTELCAAGRTSKGRTLDGMALARSAVEALDEAHHAAETGELPGVPTGIAKLDRATGGLHPGDLVVVGARPKMGKTALACTLTLNGARAGYAAGFASAEMSAKELSVRFVAQISDIGVSEYRSGRLSDTAWKHATEASSLLSRLSIEVLDQPAARVSDIIRQAQAWRRAGGLDLLVVDYLQRLQPDGKAERRDLAVGAMAQALKTLARDLDIPVVLLAQLSRAVEQRQEKRPTMSDLRDSGQVEQEADQVWLLYRPAAYSDKADPRRAEIIVDANRHGPPGFVVCDFDPPTGRWS